MKNTLFFPLAAVVLALCTGLANGQRPVIEVDVVATDAGDGFVGLSEVSTDNLATNTIARVKGQTTPGDGGGGNYLWTGAAWVKYLADDYRGAGSDALNAKVFGAICDGQSHPLSATYATLEEAQEDFPAAEALTDETDWAAIQSALDRVNPVIGEDFGGTVFLPAGHYVVNKTIEIKGPGVTLQGAGNLSTYVRFINDSGYGVRLYPTGGGDLAGKPKESYPKHTTIRGIKFGIENDLTNTMVGFSTVSPQGGKGFWYVIYLSLIKADFEGFDVSVELSNTPIASMYHCSITGISRSLRLWGVDSLTAVGCDINGTYLKRTSGFSGQRDYDTTNINIEMPQFADDGSDIAGDEIFGGAGSAFHITIIGGELGHCAKVADIGYGRLSIKGSNIEDVNDSEAFRMSSFSYVAIDSTRFELGDPSNTDSVFYIDAPTGATSVPRLWLRECIFEGWDQDAKPVVKAEGGAVAGVIINTDLPWRTDFYGSTSNLLTSLRKSGNLMSYNQFRINSGDNNTGNELLAEAQGPIWIGASTTAGEDLLTAYVDEAGNYRRTSILNTRLMRHLHDQTTETTHPGGINQMISAATVSEDTLLADGDKLVVRAGGSFAANADLKGVRLRFLFQGVGFVQFESTDYNGQDWILESTIQRTGSNTAWQTTKFFVDGLPVRVTTGQIVLNLLADRTLEVTGRGSAGDVTVGAFDVTYEKGTSNL